jgi:type VI secretion system protein ImpF
MTQARARDRLQPALLDRLTDNDPQASTEGSDARVMSRHRLREAVLRDLSWLFNTTALSGVRHLDDFNDVRRSVLNYGLAPLSGLSASSIDPSQIESIITQAIIDFEPRILRNSLRVELLILESQVAHHNQITVRIEGQLWAEPVPLELLLQTAMDLETGQVLVKELAY